MICYPHIPAMKNVKKRGFEKTGILFKLFSLRSHSFFKRDELAIEWYDWNM